MTTPQPNESVWPRRWALLLCVLTFPLIWVGGLITTTDAGMAVPDWPGTYGYNMFLYPWYKWVQGPWDLFIEHGHRLLASLIGLVTIVLLVVVWRSEAARPLRPLAVAALAMVLFQGVLGGLRVVANERLLAMAHGVTGPLFFALTCVIAARARPFGQVPPDPDRLRAFGRLAAITAGLAAAQLTLGAALRHMPETAGPWAFAAIVKLHLLLAAVVVGHAVWLSGSAIRGKGWPTGLRVAGAATGVVVLLQFAVGLATWLLKFGAPGWAEGLLPANMAAVVAGGWWQKHLVTAHQAGGSLLLGLASFAAALALRHPAPNVGPDAARGAAVSPPRSAPA